MTSREWDEWRARDSMLAQFKKLVAGGMDPQLAYVAVYKPKD